MLAVWLLILNYLICNNDFGAKVYRTSIVVLAEDTVSQKILTELVVELLGVPYDCQKNFISLIIKSLPELESGASDKGGVGANLSESLNYQFPKVQAIQPSASWLDASWIKLLRVIESKRLQLPQDPLIMGDFSLVQYNVHNSPRISPDARLNSKHGDTASAYNFAVSTMQIDEAKPSARNQPSGTVWSHRQKQYLPIAR